MNASIKQLLEDKIVLIMLSASILVLAINAGFIFLTLKNLPPLIPIFNQLPWGEDRLGTKMFIFAPVGIVVLFLIANIFFSSLTYKNMPLISRFIMVISFLVSILALLIVLRTILNIL